MSDSSVQPDVVALRPFVPASDFEKSLRFYEELGYTATRLGDGLASMQLGLFGFLLQDYCAEGFAGNFMMQMLVEDVQEWWRRIEALDLPNKYGVRTPLAPAVQPWGLTVAYMVDPAGVLWHIAQVRS